MAKLINLQLLVRDDDEQRIEDGVRDMLMQARTPVDPDDPDVKPWLATWSVKGIDSVNDAVAQMLGQDSEAIDAILETQFVICFAGASLDQAFYSSNFGPSALDLATKFTAASVCEALGLGEQDWRRWCDANKAYVTPAPYGLARYAAKVMVPGELEVAGAEEVKSIELWASDEQQARESVEATYGRDYIVSVRPA